jgi:hypothetical protein
MKFWMTIKVTTRRTELEAETGHLLIKSSRAISRVSWLKITDVSGTISVPIIRAMMYP